MRIIISRKGFDSGSGGCPSPLFPDGSMFAMPIPYARSPVRYEDLAWRGHQLGDLVESLTKGTISRTAFAHLDPDLRPEMRPRGPGWRPALGQHKSAQSHLRTNGVCAGDLFLFWGLFQRFDERSGWSGKRVHVIWGWLQVEHILAVDHLRPQLATAEWGWAKDHPHTTFERDPSNTLYVGAKALALPRGLGAGLPGAGVFEFSAPGRQLTAVEAETPTRWSLPRWFHPEGRTALTYHRKPERWRRDGDRVLLESVSRGQEFVLDTREYPEASGWAASLLSA